MKKIRYRLMKMVIWGICVFCGASLFAANVFGAFEVREYGAKADGKTLDTDAVNKAITACNASGGGTVFFSRGTYLCGSIELKSNVTLYLDNGAVIVAAPPEAEAFNLPDPNPWDKYQGEGHDSWKDSLIWGKDLENIAIRGDGIIDGSGMLTHRVPPKAGDKAIALKQCTRVTIEGITMRQCGHFAMNISGCELMKIRGVTIDTNRDGMNINCCKNVTISDCIVNSEDDAICLKSTYSLGFKKACENITIANCIVSAYDAGTVLDGTYKGEGMSGRIKCGTESNGGFKNITISNCVFDNCRGIALMIVDGGILENVTISNIIMRDTTTSPIFICLGNRGRGPDNPPVGVVRNINISDVLVTEADPFSSSMIIGLPGHCVEGVTLNNIKIISKGGGTLDDAQRVPKDKPRVYPEPNRWGKMPAYGFFCRHVKDIEFNNVEVGFDEKDMRSALICEDIDDLLLNDFEAERAEGAAESVVMKDTSNVVRHSFDVSGK